MPINPKSLDNLVPPWTSETAPRQGRVTAGATLREQVNALAQKGLTEAQLRDLSRRKDEPWTRRAAALRILRTLEAGDLADFKDYLDGKADLDELRERGVDTTGVKRAKVTRTKYGEQREIELYDRSGEDFDRVTTQTAGHPVQPQEHRFEQPPTLIVRRPIEPTSN
jgi:hypothetical protein